MTRIKNDFVETNASMNLRCIYDINFFSCFFSRRIAAFQLPGKNARRGAFFTAVHTAKRVRCYRTQEIVNKDASLYNGSPTRDSIYRLVNYLFAIFIFVFSCNSVFFFQFLNNFDRSLDRFPHENEYTQLENISAYFFSNFVTRYSTYIIHRSFCKRFHRFELIFFFFSTKQGKSSTMRISCFLVERSRDHSRFHDRFHRSFSTWASRPGSKENTGVR